MRLKGVEAGILKLVETDYDAFIEAVNLLLKNEEEYAKMCGAKNPYGDGTTAKQIIEILSK